MPKKSVTKIKKSPAGKSWVATQGRTTREFTAADVSAAKMTVEKMTDIRDGWEYEWQRVPEKKNTWALHMWNTKGTYVNSVELARS